MTLLLSTLIWWKLSIFSSAAIKIFPSPRISVPSRVEFSWIPFTGLVLLSATWNERVGVWIDTQQDSARPQEEWNLAACPSVGGPGIPRREKCGHRGNDFALTRTGGLKQPDSWGRRQRVLPGAGGGECGGVGQGDGFSVKSPKIPGVWGAAWTRANDTVVCVENAQENRCFARATCQVNVTLCVRPLPG